MPVTRAIIPDPGTYYGLGREHGRRRPDGTPEIDVRGSFVDALAAALELEHPCEDPSCDIAAAMGEGFYRVAAGLLIGATECETVEDVVTYYCRHRGEEWNAYGAVGPDADRERADWSAWHVRHAYPCDTCGSYTFAEDTWTPARCGNCSADLWADVEREAVAGYVDCALWAGLDWTVTTEHGGDETNPRPLDDAYGADDITPDALDEIREDVGAFLRQWWPLASAAGWSAATFGHDYYLTRNRHGAGYWDRAWPTLPGFPEADPATIDAGDELTTAAHLEGGAELEPDDAGRLTYRQ